MKKVITFLAVAAVTGFLATTARADEATDWNRIMFEAAKVANTSPLVMTRVTAIVHGSIFDALNGIERRYKPLHVAPAAHPGASRRAAVVQAAYAALLKIYPSQASTLLNQKLAESLAGIASGSAAEHSQSIARGIEWGQTVADAIWAWRLSDGFTTVFPPFTGPVNPGAGVWRPTPPANLAMAGFQFVNMAPWVINLPSQFLPLGPPALGGSKYAADFNEAQLKGSAQSPSRTQDETVYSLFWNSTTASYLWNNVAVSLGNERHTTLSENSRLLALLNVSMADAAIGCWNAKLAFNFWRPITAIVLAGTDGNPATIADPNWVPLLTTPNHQDYPSGHSCVSGAAGAVLSDFFGEQSSFVVASDNSPVTRFHPSFTAATNEVKNARIFSGIHFRAACDDGQILGVGVAGFVRTNAFVPLNGNKGGQSK